MRRLWMAGLAALVTMTGCAGGLAGSAPLAKASLVGGDVVVASNLFGDLLTDLGAVIGGGLGLAPSTNTNPEREYPSMFEPVHGSAPDIAGQGIANPIACILSAAMMLDHLEQLDAANAIRRAVEASVADGNRTHDMGGTLSTTEMTDTILAALGA